MSRGLTSNEISNLETTVYKVENLVEIYLDNSQYFYYTNGQHDITLTTPTAGSKTFIRRSFLSAIGSIKESFEAQPNNLDLQFQRMFVGANDFGSDDAFTSYLTADIINKRVVMYKLFRDAATNVADTSDGLIQIFDGTISGMDIETNLESKVYTIRCTNDFGDYDKTRGRTTASIYGALSKNTIYWGSFYF